MDNLINKKLNFWKQLKRFFKTKILKLKISDGYSGWDLRGKKKKLFWRGELIHISFISSTQFDHE